MLEKILSWAQGDINIRAAVLTGSRAATKENADELADFDVALFCETYRPYIQDNHWLNSMGEVWLCVKEKIQMPHTVFPTRLVIFSPGIKVDFAFFSLDVFRDFVKDGTLPGNEVTHEFQLLLDKDLLAKNLPKHFTRKPYVKKPSQQDFQEVVTEFWFEAYHVAKYLKREDLWSVKFRAGIIYDRFLLKMIEWHAQAKDNWQNVLPPNGKKMKSWTDEQTWNELSGIFAHFDKEDSELALKKMVVLFRRLSKYVAEKLGYPYPEEMDKNLSSSLP